MNESSIPGTIDPGSPDDTPDSELHKAISENIKRVLPSEGSSDLKEVTIASARARAAESDSAKVRQRNAGSFMGRAALRISKILPGIKS